MCVSFHEKRKKRDKTEGISKAQKYELVFFLTQKRTSGFIRETKKKSSTPKISRTTFQVVPSLSMRNCHTFENLQNKIKKNRVYITLFIIPNIFSVPLFSSNIFSCH